MTRRPPCSRFCPLITACRECDWQSLWRCQVCQGPAHEGEVICTECAGQESYTDRISTARNDMLSETEKTPASAGTDRGRGPLSRSGRV